MARGGKVTDRDLGWKHIKAQTAILAKRPRAVVGVRGKDAQEAKVDADGEKGSLTLAQVATFHEYGAPAANIPERSFIRASVDEKLPAYRTMIEQLKGRIFDPKKPLTVRQALLILGEKVKLDIQARMRAGLQPAWSEATRQARIARGTGIVAETPLIDTGQLIGGITNDVEYPGGGKV